MVIDEIDMLAMKAHGNVPATKKPLQTPLLSHREDAI